MADRWSFILADQWF